MSDLQQHLTVTLGLDPRVAHFFTNRKRPEGNEYWLNQTDYMSAAPGFVFIPIYFDLLIKQGVKADELLTDNLLIPMERILQSAGKQEYNKISHASHIDDCHNILRKAGVIEKNIARVERELVDRPFTRIPSRFQALRRANTFLFTFAGRKFDTELLFAVWELVVPLFLMLDDFSDIDKDLADKDDNCLLDGGSITENFFELTALVDRLLRDLSAINPALAGYLKAQKDEAVARNMLLIMTKGTK